MHIYTSMHIYVYMHIYILMYVYAYIYMHTYIHTYMQAYIHTYIHTYTYIGHQQAPAFDTRVPISAGSRQEGRRRHEGLQACQREG